MDNKNRATVLIFSHAYLPFPGGAETAMKGITDQISDIEFIMLTGKYRRDLPREEKLGNIFVYRLGVGTRYDKFLLPVLVFFKFFSIRKNISGKFMFWAMMVSYSSVAALFLKYFYPEVPLLLTLQEGDSEEHIRSGRFGLIAFFWKRLIKKADHVQTISNYLKGIAVSFGAHENKISVVPNGVDIEMFSNPDLIEREDIKSALGIKEGDKVLFTDSRLVRKNAVDVVIQSMQFLRSYPKLVILGGGEEEGKLKALVGSLGLLNRVQFMGAVEHEYVPAYFSIADVFVRPSRSEGLGVVFFEAMAAGIPIIATSVGGIKDFLVDGETGLAVRVDDPKDLAEKIDRLLAVEARPAEQTELRQKLIRNGRKLVEERYTWTKIASTMKEIFIKLLTR